jgi:hypothetical protein
MSTTFKSWLVANLELVTAVVLSVIIIPLYVIFAGKDTPVDRASGELGDFFTIFFFLLVIPYVLVSIPPRLIIGIVIYLLILGLGICLFFLENEKTGEHIFRLFSIAYLSVFVGASVLSFFIARYAKYNFDELVSRRMLYRNSRVGLFEIEWEYTIDRFCIATFCILDAILSIGFLIAFLTL